MTKLNQISSLRSDQKRNKTDKFLQKLSAQQILRAETAECIMIPSELRIRMSVKMQH